MAASTLVNISEDKSFIVIEGILAIGGDALSMTCTSDGSIVITGYVPEGHSHLTVVNIKGETLRQEKFPKSDRAKFRPYRRCDSLPLYKVATMCESGEIGVYDVRDGGYVKKDTGDFIRDVIPDWSPERYISCVAVDPVSKNIFVGTKSTSSAKIISREMLVFDDKLNYIRMLVLPDVVKGSRDVTVHDHHLVVCDHWGRNAYLVTMEGTHSNLVRTFTKPDLDGADWIPYKVCTDSRGFIYMLWESWGSDDWKAVLTQHSRDGCKLLATIPVDGYADAICSVKTEEGEKLLLVARKSAKMYTFNLSS